MENLSLFQYCEGHNGHAISMRHLVILCQEGNVLFPDKIDNNDHEDPTPTQPPLYSWFVPGQQSGEWSRLKTIQQLTDWDQIYTLWDRTKHVATHLKEQIVVTRTPIHSVPMSSVYYEYWDGDKDNFSLYVNRNGTFLKVEYDGNGRVVLKDTRAPGPSILYKLSTNEPVPVPTESGATSRWDVCENDTPGLSLGGLGGGWDTCDPDDQYITDWRTQTRMKIPNVGDETPVNDAEDSDEYLPDLDEPCETDEEISNLLNDTVDYDSDTEEDEEGPRIVEGEPVDTPIQTPEIPEYSDSDESEDPDYETEESDVESCVSAESAESAESVVSAVSEEEPDTRYRMDESDGNWYTKDEFYEYYGSDQIWDAMHPHNQFVRHQMYWTFYNYGNFLSQKKLKLLLKELKMTYY